MRKPTKEPAGYVCSVCGQPWAKHGEQPTLEDCVRELKAKVQAREMPWNTELGGLSKRTRLVGA